MEQIPVLVVVEGPLKGKEYPLEEGEDNTIGRADSCHVTIPDNDVSRQHARIILHNAAVWVQDDNSRNGVFVNEKRVVRRPLELRPGGRVSIGIHVFELQLQEKQSDAKKDVELVTSEENESSSIMWLLVGVALAIAAIVFFVK